MALDKRTIEAWLRMHVVENNSDKEPAEFWAYEIVDDLVRHGEAREALEAIFHIAQTSRTEPQRANLGAGHLEDLLVYKGSEVIDRVEELARQNEKFKDTLNNVWKNDISDEVWGRIQKALGRA